MNHLLEATERAVADRNWYAALMMALMLPDICARPDGPKGGSADRYEAWAEKWVEPFYPRDMPKRGQLFVSHGSHRLHRR